jgi:hypothetical protein
MPPKKTDDKEQKKLDDDALKVRGVNLLGVFAK